jgi:thiamine-monophosphate kinase
MLKRRRSEDSVIRLIQQTIIGRGKALVGIGDDACVLPGGLVLTTDAYADRVHFDLGYMSWREVGGRCACAAISDVVAMGAEPEVVLVALGLPRSGTDRDVRSLYQGIDAVCGEMGSEIAGGDIIVTDRLCLAITVTGRTRRPLLRSGAKPGDTLYVTGSLGAAEAGRLLLARAARSGRGVPAWGAEVVRRHVRPIPRQAVARQLRRWTHALIDTSDGLGTDARHLAERSGVRIVIDSAALPVSAGTSRFCRGQGIDLTEFVLGAGEDYELLFASPVGLPDAVRGVRLTAVGRIERGRGLWLERDGRIRPLRARGYDHVSQVNRAANVHK